MTADRVDVAVVGGGIAGLVAANRAAQHGLRVIVLEQGTAEKYFCNSRFTGGTFHAALNDVMSGRDHLLAAIERTTAGAADDALALAIAEDAERAVRWLQSERVRFIRASASPHHRWVLAPPGRVRSGLDWEGRGGDVLLRTLEASLARRGSRMLRGTRAVGVIREDGVYAGLVAERDGGRTEIRSDELIIADGGFQGDLDLLRRHVSPMPERLKQRGAGTGRGDGIRLARELGAKLSAMDCFYGHLLSRDALENDDLWPYPYLDALARSGIVVDRAGRRFADEGVSGVFMANAVARLADPLSATVVIDAPIWGGPGREGLIPTDPHLTKAGATMFRADTIEELAERAGIGCALVGTVGNYNRALADGSLAALDPPREAKAAMPIATPPFYAIPVCAGITYTMGGILTDAAGRVLAEDGSPIARIYAAGATTGGLEGGPRAGYVGGLIKGTVFGLRAAEDIARRRGTAPADDAVLERAR